MTLRTATLSRDLLDRLVAEARSLGADAIVVTTDGRGTAAASGGNEAANVNIARGRTLRIEVRALKYLP